MMTSSSRRSSVFDLYNAALFAIFLFALFCLLTNAIPLVQWGWLKDLGKKNRYMNLTTVFCSLFSVLLVIVRCRCREFFEASWVVRIWNQICRLPLGAVTAALFVLFAGLMTVVGFERQLALETRAFDLGIFAQAVWNTLQGDFLFSSLKENICLLGDHVSPLLVVLVPFYKVWADPRTLILVQAVASASSLFPLAILAEQKLKDRSLVLIFLLMFIFFYPMRAALHEDFHPETLAEPFFWWAFLFLEERHVKSFVLCLLIAATGKENFLGITFMLGLYAFVWKKMRKVGTLVMIASVGLFLWETRWLIPHLTGTGYFYSGNYARMLKNPVSVVLMKLLDKNSLDYAFRIFLPFLFLPLFHFPTLLLTFPILFQNFLSENAAMRSFNYHYATGLTPFLFISTIYAMDALVQKKESVKRHRAWVGFALLFVSLLRSGPSEYYSFWETHGHRTAHTEMIREKLEQIPANLRVLTHNGFIPQLCNRKYVYQFNYNPLPTKLDFAKKYHADIVIWDEKFWEPHTGTPSLTLQEFITAGYHVAFEKDGFYILQRN